MSGLEHRIQKDKEKKKKNQKGETSFLAHLQHSFKKIKGKNEFSVCT